MPEVMIFMGSASDREKVLPCAELLESLSVSWQISVCSAHRSPERVIELVEKAEKENVKVFICAAGMAAHLAGAIAARTIRPVIGIPLSGSALNGLDALLSTVQMPAGYPVATLALDKAGALNAAWLAAEIIAIGRPGLSNTIIKKRGEMLQKILAASDNIEKEAEKLRKS